MNGSLPGMVDETSGRVDPPFAEPAPAEPPLVAIAVLAVAALLFTNVYPVFLGALETAGRASAAQIGRLATVEYFFMAVTALFIGKVFPLNQVRRVAVAVALIQFAAVVASNWLSGDQFLMVRAIFASASGIQVWLMYEFIGRASKPGRLVGACTAIVVVVAVLSSALATNYIVPTFGVDGLIVFFGLPSLAAAVGAWWLPGSIQVPGIPSQPSDPRKSSLSPSSIWLLVSGFAWSAWISILWIYSEPLSRSIGISESASRTFVYASLISAVAGAGLGTLLAEQSPFRWVLTLGLAVCLTHVVFLLTGVGSAAYVAWFGVFGFLGYFLLPFFVKALVAADRGGESVAFFPAAQYGGASLGPLIASFLVAPGQYRGGLIASLASIMVAIGALGIGLYGLRRIPDVRPE